MVFARFRNLGGEITSFITPFSYINPYDVTIGAGSMVLNKASVEPDVLIGEECLLITGIDTLSAIPAKIRFFKKRKV